MRSLIVALIGWELLARFRNWKGLSWSYAIPRGLLALGLVWPLSRRPGRTVLGAILLAPIALLLQLVAGSARHPLLNPLRRLAVGDYPDRTIRRVDLPMPQGVMPALYIVPTGEVVGAVVVLHGSGCDKTYYAWRMADTFIANGMAALLVDLDGHGENPRIQQFPEMLEDATVGVAWLRQQHKRVGLVGISLGGCLAARAVADGLGVDALALLEAPPFLYYTRDDMIREALALSEPFLLDLLSESTPFYLGATIYDLINVQSGPRIRYAIGTADLIAALDLLGSLPKIKAPLLLFYGSRDSIVRPDQAQMAQTAAPPQANVVMIQGASHLSLILHPGALQHLGVWLGEKLGGMD